MFLETLYIFLIAMSPLVEISGAIPLAIVSFNFTPLHAYIVALAGNLIPPLFLIPFLGRVDAYLSVRSTLWKRVFTHFFEKTRDNHIKKFEVLKELTLFVLLVIPTPFTGVWTASLFCHIFGISLKKAMPLIIVGQLIAGGIVVGATLGVSAIF